MQTGGNALQIWGDTNTLGLDVKYLEGKNLQGLCLLDGISSGQTAKGVTIEYGRATNTNQNPRYARQSPWDSHGESFTSEFGPLLNELADQQSDEETPDRSREEVHVARL